MKHACRRLTSLFFHFATSLGLLFAGTFSSFLGAEPSEAEVEVDLHGLTVAARPLAAGAGQMSRSSTGVDLSVPLAGTPQLGVGLDLGYEIDRFHFSDFSSFLSGDASPLSRAFDFYLQPSFLVTPSERWTFVISPQIEYSGAEHTRLKDARLWSGSVGVFYQSIAGFKLGLGLNLAEQMNGSPLVLPFPIIDWELNDHWKLSALDGESGRLAYRASARFSLYGEVRFKSRDIRLATHSSIPSGILRTEEYPTFLGFEYRFFQHALIRAALGKAWAQTIRFEDHGGRLLRRSDSRAPGVGTLQAELTF